MQTAINYIRDGQTSYARGHGPLRRLRRLGCAWQRGRGLVYTTACRPTCGLRSGKPGYHYCCCTGPLCQARTMSLVYAWAKRSGAAFCLAWPKCAANTTALDTSSLSCMCVTQHNGTHTHTQFPAHPQYKGTTQVVFRTKCCLNFVTAAPPF